MMIFRNINIRLKPLVIPDFQQDIMRHKPILFMNDERTIFESKDFGLTDTTHLHSRVLIHPYPFKIISKS